MERPAVPSTRQTGINGGYKKGESSLPKTGSPTCWRLTVLLKGRQIHYENIVLFMPDGKGIKEDERQKKKGSQTTQRTMRRRESGERGRADGDTASTHSLSAHQQSEECRHSRSKHDLKSTHSEIILLDHSWHFSLSKSVGSNWTVTTGVRIISLKS